MKTKRGFFWLLPKDLQKQLYKHYFDESTRVMMTCTFKPVGDILPYTKRALANDPNWFVCALLCDYTQVIQWAEWHKLTDFALWVDQAVKLGTKTTNFSRYLPRMLMIAHNSNDFWTHLGLSTFAAEYVECLAKFFETTSMGFQMQRTSVTHQMSLFIGGMMKSKKYSPQRIDTCLRCFRAITRSAWSMPQGFLFRSGNLEMVQFYLMPIQVRGSPFLCIDSMKGESIAVLQWLYDCGAVWDAMTFYEHSSFEVFKWCVDHGMPRTLDNPFIRLGFNATGQHCAYYASKFPQIHVQLLRFDRLLPKHACALEWYLRVQEIDYNLIGKLALAEERWDIFAVVCSRCSYEKITPIESPELKSLTQLQKVEICQKARDMMQLPRISDYAILKQMRKTKKQKY